MNWFTLSRLIVVSTFLCFYLVNIIYCQGPQNANDVEQHAALNIQKNYQILPTVEGATLGEYGEYNVNLYTGVPQIGIPIYSLKGNKLHAEVGLSYKASGIKVADGVSMVGSGWSLTGLPMISRVVAGNPDMKSNYFSKKLIIETGQNAPNNVSFDEYDFLYSVANFSVETQPDQYYYSLLGKSGNFYITPNKEVIQTEYSDIKIGIEWDSFDDDINKFTITDEYGTVYTFDITEQTLMQYNDVNGLDAALNRQFPETGFEVEYNSSWHISQVKTYDGTESLEYQYYTSTVNTEIPINYDLFYSKVYKKCVSDGAGNPSPTTVSGAPQTGTIIKNKRTILSIKRKVGIIEAEELEFNHLASSCSITQKYATDRKLDNIFLSRKGGGNLIRWNFTHDCSTGRLTLKNLENKNISNNVLGQKYSFTYNSTSLPELTSNRIDHWGYLNFSNSISPAYNFSTGVLNLSSRTVSPTSALAGSLSTISYPTGGKTSFIFESNQITKNSTSTNYTPIYNGPFTYDLESCGGTNTDCCQTINGIPNSSQAEEVIYFNNNIITDGYVHIRANEIDCSQGGMPLRSSQSVTYTIKLISENGTITNIDSRTNISGPVNKYVKIPANLSVGFYTLTISGISTYVETHVVQETSSTVPITEFLGGLRIKEIKHYDSDNIQLKKTIYKYTKEGSNESSGLLFAKPEYQSISYYQQFQVNTIGGGSNMEEDACTTVTISNSNSNELLHAQGSPIGYSRVEEIQVVDFNDDNMTNGKTVYHFHNELFSSLEADPVFNGKLKIKEVLDSSGDLVFSEEYNYSTDSDLYDRDIDFYGYKVVPQNLQDNQAYLVKNGNSFTWTQEINIANAGDDYSIYESKLIRKDYRRMVQAYVFPTSKKETWHYGNNKQISKETNFEYNNSEYLQPTKESVVNSNGKEYFTLFQYPDTYANNTIKTKMKSNNIVLPAWRTNQYVRDGSVTTLIDGTITEWTDFVPNIYPSKERRYELTWDASGNTISSGWINNVFYGAYDEVRGMPSIIKYRGWEKNGQFINHQLSWSTTGKLLTNTFDTYMTTNKYFLGNDQLEKVTHIDRTSTSYKYDQLLRLEEVKEDCTGSKENIDYNYYSQTDKANIMLTKFFPTIGSQHQNIILQTKNYVDGLGRGVESVRIKQDPNSSIKDIFEGVSYDNVGRSTHQYEPRLSNENNLGSFQVLGGSATITGYEDSPLNRHTSIKPPNWFASNIDYDVNVSSDKVKRQYRTGFYPINTLHKTTTTDANGNKQIVFTDKLGREVLLRQESNDGSERSDTYKVYDDKHRIIKMLPPGATNSTTKLLYSYLYSGDDLMIEKKVPDQEVLKYTYDDRDLMLSYQDGYLRAQNKQYNYLYDNLGRVKTEGFAAEGSNILSQPLIINTYGTDGIDIGKIKNCSKQLLEGSGFISTDYVYDNCGRKDYEFSNHLLNLSSLTSFYKDYAYDSQHNLLEDREMIFTQNNDIHECRMYTDYDRIGRLSKESMNLQSSGIKELSAMEYTHKEQLERLLLGNINNTMNYLQEVNYRYSPRRTLSRINNLGLQGNNCRDDATTQSQRSSFVPDLFYQNLLYSINQGDCNEPFEPITTGDYRNDNIGGIAWQVRGRPTQIFGYEYDYLDRIISSKSGINTNADGTTVNNLYNTNYTYDDSRGNLATVLRSGYKENGNNIFIHGQIDNLVYSFDNGTNRIQSIVDNGSAAVKDQGYNRKSSSRYRYSNDANNAGVGNGNINFDPSRQATIVYNHLNLPNSVTFADGNELHYVYDAYGKLHQRYQVEGGIKTSEQTYIGRTEFENGIAEITHHSNGFMRRTNVCDENAHLFLSIDEPIDRQYQALDISSTRKVNPADNISYIAEDYVTLNKGFEVPMNSEFLADINPVNCENTAEVWMPHYNIKDHLGNTRVVFANLNGDNTISTDEIVSESHYYPFGLQMTIPDAYKTGGIDYLYNGKELQRSFDLGYYDYGARFYDPSMGRFTSVDPLAEMYNYQSTYAYAANNPITNIDIMGMAAASTQELIQSAWDQGEGTYDNNGHRIEESTATESDAPCPDPPCGFDVRQRAREKAVLTGQDPGGKEMIAGMQAELDGAILGAPFPPIVKGLGWLKRLLGISKASKGVGNLVKIGEISDDVIIFSSKFGDEAVQGVSNFKVVGDKLLLDKLHLQGSAAGEIGRANLWNMAKDLGKQFNVKEVIIQGGKRTTGKYKGTVPSQISIKVN